MDTYDQIAFQNGIASLPTFRGFDRETGEWGEWGVEYLWSGDKWRTHEEVEAIYRERLGIYVTDSMRQYLDSQVA